MTEDSLHSPVAWLRVEGVEEALVKKLLERTDEVIASCSKPKCVTLRHLVFACCYEVLNDLDLAYRHIQFANEALTSWRAEDDESRLRRKVTGILISETARVIGQREMLSVKREPEEILTAEERAMFYFLKGRFLNITSHKKLAVPELERSVAESSDSTFAHVCLGKTLRMVRKFTDRFQEPDDHELDVLEMAFKRRGCVRAACRLALGKMDKLYAVRLPRSEYESRWLEILQLADFVVENLHACGPMQLVHCGDVFMASPVVLNRRTEAEALYRKALEMDATMSYTRHKLGKYLLLHGKVDEGFELLRKALDPRFPNFQAHLEYLGAKFYVDESNELDEGFRNVLEMARGFHMRVALMVTYAQYKALRGDTEGALRLLDEAKVLQKQLGIDCSSKYDAFPPKRYQKLREVLEPPTGEGKPDDSSKSVEPALKGTQPHQLLWRRGADGVRSNEGYGNQRGRGGSRNHGSWNSSARGLHSWKNRRWGSRAPFTDGQSTAHAGSQNHVAFRLEKFTVAELKDRFQKAPTS